MLMEKVTVDNGGYPEPLVSIGVPTFNRPKWLKRTLENLSQQTYKNIEIIVSDNASTDKQVEEVIHAFSKADSRIVTIKQKNNIGSLNNFFTVLEHAKAEYFMWAADDDYIEPWFVEKALKVHLDNPGLSISTFEAQYITVDNVKLPFVPEGSAFRRSIPVGVMGRLAHMIDHNFGNLVYGLFRKEALIQNGEIFWKKSGLHSLNEIPPLLYAASIGEISIHPEVGIYKQAPSSVHAQVLWEINGGLIPSSSRILSLSSAKATWKYHSQTLAHISNAIKLLPLTSKQKAKIQRAAYIKLLAHFIYMLIGFKPRYACDKP